MKIAVTGKGGVGKTTLAGTLAIILSEKFKVYAIDADPDMNLAGSLGIVWQTKIRMEIKVLVEVMFPTIFLLCLWFYGGNISLKWVFGTYLLARIITLAWGWWLGRGTIDLRLIDKKIISKLLKISWPMGLYLLIFSAYDRAVDSLMIQRFLGTSEVAWYGLAYKIYGVLIQPAYFLVNGIFPI